MRLFGLFIGVVVIIFGSRLVITALQAAFTGRVLVRRGLRTRWEPAANPDEILSIVLRTGLMGLLLIALGVFLIF